MCSTLKREVVRVNITIETDEDDLVISAFVNGSTVWHNGPAIEALERGLSCSLTRSTSLVTKFSVSKASLKVMVYSLKLGRYVKPSDGFNVIATANTKGKGSDDGRFIGTNVLNEAFLERFQ